MAVLWLRSAAEAHCEQGQFSLVFLIYPCSVLPFCTLKKKGGGGNITFSLNFLAEESCPGCRVCSASCLKEVEEVRDNSMCVTSEQKPGPVHLVPCSGTLSTGEKHHLLA